MAEITLKGETLHTCGTLPETGSEAPQFTLTGTDMAEYDSTRLQSGAMVLNIFPSLDTSVCAASVRRFNKQAASLKKAVVLCISMDLPFAQDRFCVAEGIENVKTLSAFRHPEFGEKYGVTMTDGPLEGLLARAVVVVNMDNKVIYSELVPEIAQEPNYEAALEALQEI